jgi:hypothetical protein
VSVIVGYLDRTENLPVFEFLHVSRTIFHTMATRSLVKHGASVGKGQEALTKLLLLEQAMVDGRFGNEVCDIVRASAFLLCINMTCLLDCTPAGPNLADDSSHWSRAGDDAGTTFPFFSVVSVVSVVSFGRAATEAAVLTSYWGQSQDIWGGKPDAGGASLEIPTGRCSC